jgi:RNA polymerase sigma-70 factor (ECF subfamily)
MILVSSGWLAANPGAANSSTTMDAATDADLAIRARQGDAEAFAELVRRYQASVFGVCYRLLGERRSAEDLAQEAFIRAYTHLGSYQVERPFGPWIRRVAANLCINQLTLRQPLAVPLEEDERLGSAEDGPEEQAARRERAQSIQDAIHSLPTHQRAVIELSHFHGLSYAEIAAELRLPLSDVKSHLFRARRRLAEMLKHDPA